MALNNLANLFSTMQQWAIDRPDLVPQFQDAVDMAINDINQVLRMKEQQTTVMLTPDANSYITLPDDYLEWRAVRWLGTPRTTLTPLTPEGDTDEYETSPPAGPPFYFTMDDDGTRMRILPLVGTDDQVQLKYWKKVPYLTNTPPNDTNWLLQKNANIILFGAMKYVEVYKRNDKGMATFGNLYSGEIDGLIRSGKRQQWSRTHARVSGRSTP